MPKLKDRVAIVTGSGQGIGEAIAKTFASEGAYVIVDDVNREQANRVVHEIEAKGGKAMAVASDVNNRGEVQELIRTTLERFKAIHIFVNNAGIRRHKPLLQLTEEDWDLVLDVDLKAVFNCTQAVLVPMMSQRYGKIVNIASLAGLGGGNDNPANYASAKAGVVALTKVTAREAGPYGINVNCVAPGFILTPEVHKKLGKDALEAHIERRSKATVLGRVGTPRDVSNVVLFLVCEDSAFISGQVIRVDGGRTDLL